MFDRMEEDAMTDVTDRPPTKAAEVDSVKRTNRLLVITVVVLAMALVGLGAWALLDDGSSEAAPPAAVEQVIASYEEARNTLNPELFESIVTDDFTAPYTTFTVGASQVWDTGTSTRTDVLHGLTTSEGWVAWEVSRVGDPTSVGDGPWHVSVPTVWVISGGAWEGIAVYTVVDDGGTLLLSEASSFLIGLPAGQ